MTLYLQAKTTVTDLTIDYIEISLTDGSTVSLNWDESRIDRDETGFNAEYAGVCFNETPANDRIDELQGMQVVTVGLYSETRTSVTILITKMDFIDGEKRLSFETAYHCTQEVKENG